MKANVLYSIGDLRYTDIEIPKIVKGWVLLKMCAAGICGSDVARVFTNGTYHFPTIIGHEFAGIVEHVFDQSDTHLIGKRVAVYPLIPCKKCRSCMKGEYELCDSYNYLGSRCDGGFAEYVLVPKWNLKIIPDIVSYEEAAMFEPACVAIHAIRRADMKEGDNVIIIGPGTIGIIMAQIASLMGAKNVMLIGRSQSKLVFAQKNGILNTYNFFDDNLITKINKQTENVGADIVIEGTGASQSLELGLKLIRPAGRLLCVGNPSTDIHLTKNLYWQILRKQLTLIGTWNSSFGNCNDDWTMLIHLIESGKLKLTNLITHTLALSDLYKGLLLMKDSETFTNKIMIKNN